MREKYTSLNAVQEQEKLIHSDQKWWWIVNALALTATQYLNARSTFYLKESLS